MASGRELDWMVASLLRAQLAMMPSVPTRGQAWDMCGTRFASKKNGLIYECKLRPGHEFTCRDADGVFVFSGHSVSRKFREQLIGTISLFERHQADSCPMNCRPWSSGCGSVDMFSCDVVVLRNKLATKFGLKDADDV